MERLFERVKSAVKIADVVERFGVKLDRTDKAKCPFHQEDTPSFSVKRSEGIFKCFGCNASGDAIDFVARLKGVDGVEAAKLLADLYGVSETVSKGSRKVDKVTAATVKPPRDANVRLCAGVKNYITACAATVGQTDYLIKRGLTETTIKQFHLGYDPEKQCVVLPYSSKLDYYSTRSTVDKKFCKPKTEEAGQEPIWGAKALSQSGAVFVVESPICAMSVSQCGGQAVSICGTGYQKLLKEVKSKKPNCTLILSLDNDAPGQEAQAELANQLYEIGVKFVPFNIAGECKDPNELLVIDQKALAESIVKATAAAREKFRSRKDSMSAMELCNRKHRVPRKIVEDLIVEGLTLFCAPHKLGKSWLVLDLCFSVALGKNFWGYKTEQCGALYYCLEDTDYRIDDRIKKLYGKCPSDDVRFIFETDKLGAGFLEHLTTELDSNPNIGFVVVDTLKMIRKVNNKNNDVYGHDYEEINALKKFAENRKIALMIVHHTRKAKDGDDPFANILGTGALAGAADTSLVLQKRKRADKEAVLTITGRDVKEREMVMEFGALEDYKWAVIGDAAEMEAQRQRKEFEDDPFVKTVKALVKAHPYGWTGTPTELSLRAYDITGDVTLSPSCVGARVNKYKTKLYYDGIDHTEKKVNGQKKHTFLKRSYKPPQWSMFKDREESDD